MGWLKRSWKIVAAVAVVLAVGATAGGYWLLSAMRSAPTRATRSGRKS